jgi:hypothetical protein
MIFKGSKEVWYEVEVVCGEDIASGVSPAMESGGLGD